MKLNHLPRQFLAASLLAGLGAYLTSAAPIPKLFNTGVDDTGALLGASAVDPHYQLIDSADPAYPGPDAFTLEPGFPVGPWIAEGPASRWIAPRARQGTGSEPGNYTFRTTFDLTGFDPTKAKIAGKWSVDNTGVDIVLNGNSLGLVNGSGFGGFADFTIDYGFVDGVNTLDFILNNAGDAVNPAGIRVEMIGTVEVAGEAPRIVTAPVGGTYLVGNDVTLSVVADGTPPLEYQWQLNGADVAGATEATLSITGIAVTQGGDYTVRVKNGSGEITSPAAKVTVLEPIPKLFDTGVGDDGVLIWDGSPDPHYQLVTNPDDPAVTEPIIQDSTLFPIVAGPWIANSAASVWIGPRFETSAAAGGDYVYEIDVDLTGFDPTTAFVAGKWATDNEADILLNGASTGAHNTGNFDTLSSFRVDSGFLTGVNKLQFKVNNASAGYTGLRVEGLSGGAKKGTLGDQPRIVAAPTGATLLTGDGLDLTVLADGAKPLTYQWRRNGSDLAGKTDTKLTLANVSHADAGDYTVVVANFAGSITSVVATVTVLDRVPGVFGTGVDATGAVLADGEVDPHYKLTLNTDNPASQDALVQDSTVFPISDGTWFRNSDQSKWIGPRFETSGAAGGDYTYKTTFDLTGFDPSTAVLLGSWATDNLGTDLKLNGTSTGLLNGTQFAALTSFTITSGFQAGVNTLEFSVNNSDAVAGYTGLRVENLRLGANLAGSTAPKLGVQLSGKDVVISWPASATGYKLFATPALGSASWTEVTTATTPAGDQLTVKITAPTGQQFYRLQK